jgi:hypothetical protein
MVLPSRDIGKVVINNVIKIRGKVKKVEFFKLEIKQDINEIISNKITYRNFKLKDNRNIYKVVKADIFKNFITRKPYNEFDTTNLDLFD